MLMKTHTAKPFTACYDINSYNFDPFLANSQKVLNLKFQFVDIFGEFLALFAFLEARISKTDTKIIKKILIFLLFLNEFKSLC